jgi:peptidoglycan/xylan/chitin deacetylase (PgdA/CDA1 family)
MPHFSEQVDTVERWRLFPAWERADDAEAVVLTFDDGPDEDATPAVLDALDAAGARATFFLVGEQVEAHPSLARELTQRGHDVQLHGYRHVAHDRLAPDEARHDLERGARALREVAGVRALLPSTVRPLLARLLRGLPHAGATADSRECRGARPAAPHARRGARPRLT